MEFIKILFNNIAFTVLSLLLLLLLLQQIPAALSTTENKYQNLETSPTTTTTTTATTQISQSATTTTTTTLLTSTTNLPLTYNKNKNNTTTSPTSRELRKHEQIIDNSIDFTVDPCDDFYQYACGEWKSQLYFVYVVNDQNSSSYTKDHLNNADHNHNNNNVYKYDRTLAMIDYLADKEVLKYFNNKNLTKNLYNTTTTKRSQATTTTKEPDFIIKVYKYYKSCIAIQQYEPIKYLEWLELNEHVKWPSLINKKTNTTTATITTNSKEHDHHDHQEHNANTAASTTTERYLEEADLLMDTEEEDVTDHADDLFEDPEKDLPNDQAQSEQDFHNVSTWFKTLAILRKYGLNGIFIEELIYNTKSFPSKLLLGFNKPIKDGGFKSLKNEQLKIILQNLKLHLTPDNFKQLWLKLTKFEWQLTKLNDITDDLGTTLISLEQLPVPWLYDYMKIIFKQKSNLDLNMRVVITNVAYFMALDELLQQYEDDFLQQYLQIRFLWHLYQQEPQEFLPMECILHIKNFMPLALEWIYEQENQDLVKEIPKILYVYNNLRTQFNLTLYNNKNNFDTLTLEKFVNKLENVQLKVGTFVDVDKSEFFYENRKFYQTLKISSREFYTNHLKLLKFNFEALHFNLRTITTQSPFYDIKEYYQGLTTAPYYNQRLNTLHIPLSLLQPPIYHSEYPDVYKFSTLGFLLAQTLMYGFNLNNLSPEDYQRLLHQVKCLRFMDPLELNDKIADVSGLRLAYHTFFHNSPSSLNLIANRKIFFLNFAQTFCVDGSVSASTNDISRSHVNYALAQFTEFSRTFECSFDSHMNPHEKCYLWD